MPRWTEEARRRQAEIQRQRQSWKHSTGPVTEEGKKKASLNAYKHGDQSAGSLELKQALREQDDFIKTLAKALKLSSRLQ